MDIREYRRQLEQEIADEQAAGDEPRWEESLEITGAHQEIGAATGGDDDSERLHTVLENRDASSDLRAAALGGLASRHSDPQTVHEPALERLGDESETPAVRVAALKLLKATSFHSPTAPEWKPAYREALRSASRSDDEGLRHAAFEVLAVMKDRESQAALLAGLEDPAQARVAPEHALRMLAHDPHSGVRDVARAYAEDRSSEAAHLEALRVLAGDSDSVGRFHDLLADESESPAVRTLAATALSSLDRQGLRDHASLAEESEPGGAASFAPPSPGEEQLRKHLAALLELPE